MRILTWNVLWRPDDRAARSAALADAVAAADPDVVTLQEVWRGPTDGDLAASLGRRLGFSHVHVDAPTPPAWLADKGRPRDTMGLAVLSRWPVRSRVRHVYASTGVDVGGADEGRIALVATIESPLGTLPVATTHLHSAPWDTLVRQGQVRELAELVARVDGDLPAIVTGDFNAVPEADEVRLFEGMLTAAPVPGHLFLDTARWADTPLPTWNRDNPDVAALGEPTCRIDYVFVQVTRGRPGWRVRGLDLVGARPVDGVWASDHAGLVCDLDPPATGGPRPMHVLLTPRT